MADPVSKQTPGTPAAPVVAPAVAPNGNGGPSKDAPAVVATKAAVARAGGLSGGRKRGDGLIPGSKEALEADRKKDAQRKQITRAAAASVPPPILPPQNPAPAPLPGLAAVPGAPVPPVQWQAEMLKPLTDQLVDGAEELTSGQVKRKIKHSRLPKVLQDEILEKAEWNKPAKNIVKVTAPRVAAKWLNKTGISAEYQDEVALVTAAGTLAAGHVMLCNRLDELIKKMDPPIEKPAAAKPEEKKP